MPPDRGVLSGFPDEKSKINSRTSPFRLRTGPPGLAPLRHIDWRTLHAEGRAGVDRAFEGDRGADFRFLAAAEDEVVGFLVLAHDEAARLYAGFDAAGAFDDVAVLGE